MTRWFRFYDDTVNDPKVQKLPPDIFKTWVNLLCIASKYDGKLPALSDIAFTLRMPEDKIESRINHLIEAGLLDDSDAGMIPHNWNGRQYNSDSAAERMRKYRERNKKKEVTAKVTPPLRNDERNSYAIEQSRTDTESDTEQISPPTPLTGEPHLNGKKASTRGTRLPSDWEPSRDDLQVGIDLGLSREKITHEFEKFQDHAFATGRTLVNWGAGFRMWLRKAVDYGQGKTAQRV